MPRDKNRLRVVRAEKHLTQIRLALKTKIHQSRLSLIENGYAPPTDDERGAIAKALGLSVQEIFPSDEQVAS